MRPWHQRFNCVAAPIIDCTSFLHDGVGKSKKASSFFGLRKTVFLGSPIWFWASITTPPKTTEDRSWNVSVLTYCKELFHSLLKLPDVLGRAKDVIDIFKKSLLPPYGWIRVDVQVSRQALVGDKWSDIYPAGNSLWAGPDIPLPPGPDERLEPGQSTRKIHLVGLICCLF